MKQIQSAVAEAPKLDGRGNIKYRLWVNGDGNLYVQFDANDETGTFSGLLFSVAEYAAVRNMTASIPPLNGYGLADKAQKISGNRNDGAFLKAVLRHLLPEQEVS
jgi:hypothetical protein